jgi:hypothetical protein
LKPLLSSVFKVTEFEPTERESGSTLPVASSVLRVKLHGTEEDALSGFVVQHPNPVHCKVSEPLIETARSRRLEQLLNEIVSEFEEHPEFKFNQLQEGTAQEFRIG